VGEELSMPRRRAATSGGLGWGPLGILLFLLIASLLAIAGGRDLIQLGTRVAIVAAFVGALYWVWRELAIRNPAFRMGSGGEAVMVLLMVAVGLIFVADPLATSLGGLVGYPTLDLISGPLISFDATAQLAGLFLVIALIFTIIIIWRRR
jgi:hypothetical protein